MGTPFQGSLAASNVTRGTDASGNPTITYSGLNLVKDSDTTDDYLFGYADGRITGSTTDGTACNPYASAPSTGTRSDVGGDGFDISWAVNGNGEPVPLTSIKYVRVYTSAALDPNNLTALPTPGIFGETSAEVCGVFVAKESGSGAAVAPTITIDNKSLDKLVNDGDVNVTTTSVSDKQQIITISGLSSVCGDEFAVQASGGTYVYMNGVATASSTVPLTTDDTLVQIINQSGTAEAFVTLLKLSA